jgi:predicted nuclease of predicted toxin-antitoxin system
MRVLIDECVDPRVKQLFPGHEVKTVHEMGWDRLADGPLLASAQELFDVLFTIDRGLEFQQNLKKLKLGVVLALIP